MNVHAVFLHFLGDAISSCLVLGAGALIHYFDGPWTMYIDPASSLLVCGIILWTTLPLVLRCSMILLQRSPHDIDVENVKTSILNVCDNVKFVVI
jgi:Co/Zn/Cd efflux system component